MSETVDLMPVSNPEAPKTDSLALDQYGLSPEHSDYVIGMQELAGSIAEKRTRIKDVFPTEPDQLLNLDNHVTISQETEKKAREKAHTQLHSILSNELKEDLVTKEISEDEDLLEDFLVDFQEDETTGLTQEQKDEIIEDIINRTVPEENTDEEIDDEVNNEMDDSGEAPTLKIASIDKAQLVRRKEILDQIDAADKLHGRARLRALGGLASSLSEVDLAIEAGVRIRKSTVKNPLTKLWRRRLIADSDFYLHKIATKGSGSQEAVDAMGRSRYYRYKTINKGKNDAYRQVASLHGNKDSLEGISISGRKAYHQGLYELSKDKDQDIDEIIDSIQITDRLRKDKARSNIAIQAAKNGEKEKAIEIANTIRWPKIRNKTLYEISRI